MRISIHALRVEGDLVKAGVLIWQGQISIHALRVEGDLSDMRVSITVYEFLSTPSGWRATVQYDPDTPPTPPISIHALRVEGDGAGMNPYRPRITISIHALRVEGDI